MTVANADTLQSPYRESVIGAFRSALQLAWCCQTVQEIDPLAKRLPLVWAVVFTAAVGTFTYGLFNPLLTTTFSGLPVCHCHTQPALRFGSSGVARVREALRAHGEDCARSTAQWTFHGLLHIAECSRVILRTMQPSVRKLRDKAQASMAVDIGSARTLPTLDETEIAFIYGGSFGSDTAARSSPSSMAQTEPIASAEPFSSQESTPFDMFVLESSSMALREVPPAVTQWEVWLRGLEQSTGTHFPMLYGGVTTT